MAEMVESPKSGGATFEDLPWLIFDSLEMV